MSDSEYSLGPEKEVVFWELVNLPSITYGTFGLYRQSAKFIPHVVVVVLENYDKQGMNVFDPFAGDGTIGTLYTYTAITVKCGPIIQLSNYIIVPHCWSPYESMFTSYRFNPKNIIEGDFRLLSNYSSNLEWRKISKWFLYSLTLILSIGLCTSLVSAANNQSLEWGISANQRFDYNLYVEHNSESIGYIYESGSNIRYYLVVESLPTIPDDIDHDDVPYAPQFDCYYLNGTEISFEFSAVIAWDARPIGNWDILIDFWLDTPVINETDIINTQDLVGYNYTTSFENRTTLKTMLYSKVNGVLHTFRMGFFNETHPEYYSLREVTLVAGGDASVLYIGAAVGIAVVVVLVIFMRRR